MLSCQKACDTLHYLWTIYLQDVARNCMDKLNVFQLVLIVFHLLQICFPLFKLQTGGSGFRLFDGSDLKTYLLMRW